MNAVCNTERRLGLPASFILIHYIAFFSFIHFVSFAVVSYKQNSKKYTHFFFLQSNLFFCFRYSPRLFLFNFSAIQIFFFFCQPVDWFFTSITVPYYSTVMEVLFSVKIFDVEFSPDLYVLRSPESKNVVFGNWSVRKYVCVCVTIRWIFNALYSQN